MCIKLLITWVALSSALTEAKYSDKILLVSMDGFRWDYLNHGITPTFDEFASRGVKVPFMNNVFLTKTFPNHYSIVTGLYEESHGIVENHMYDPVFNATFGMATHESRWWGGEPIWVTAKKQNLKTATYYWPGSEAEIAGERPDIWLPYRDSTDYKERIDTVVDWFKNNGTKVATLYYPEPDHTGHAHGPHSPEIMKKVKEMDALLGYLVQQFRNNGLINDVNIIITSDHGMTDVNDVRIIDISDHLDMTKVDRVPSVGPVLHILPVNGFRDAIIANLTKVEHMQVFKKESIPNRFHYRDNRRIMPIVLVAEEGWLVTDNKKKLVGRKLKGQHGFDNMLMSMKPIFMAIGPNFKQDLVMEPIYNVDIYPLMCKLLAIHASPNNGSLDRTAGMIRDTPDAIEVWPTPTSAPVAVASTRAATTSSPAKTSPTSAAVRSTPLLHFLFILGSLTTLLSKP